MVTVTRQTQETVSSPQGHIPSEMSKTRIIERTFILLPEEGHSFILHIDAFTDQTAGRQVPVVLVPVVLLPVIGNYKIMLNSLVLLIVAWKSLTNAGKFT